MAQEAYLCTGTHDFEDPSLPLLVGEIIVGANAFVGARAFLLPNVTIGEKAIVGACSVVTADIEPKSVVCGNPARQIGVR